MKAGPACSTDFKHAADAAGKLFKTDAVCKDKGMHVRVGDL